jgi:hypothetical protein
MAKRPMTDGEAAVLDDLEAEAVPLGLVQPITALGWTCDRRGDERTDEREVPITGDAVA